MKIAIFGSQGMLGNAACAVFRSAGYEVVALTRKDYDIGQGSPEQLKELLQRLKPDFVLNAAGVIKPQIAKFKIEETLRVNAIFPRNLAQLAKSLSFQVIHITTDCVYSGKKGAYDENDLFDADDVYGLSKNGGDIHNLMTIRTSIIGEEFGQGRSLISWAMSQKGKQINGFTNHRWNGVTTVQLSKICKEIFEKKLYKHGLFHVFSTNSVTKKELLENISEVYGLELTVQAFEAPEPCDRTLASVYELSSALSKKTVLEQLHDMKSFFRSQLV